MIVKNNVIYQTLLSWSYIFTYLLSICKIFYFFPKEDTLKYHFIMISALKSRYNFSWYGELWIKRISFLFSHTLMHIQFWKRENRKYPEVTELLKSLKFIVQILLNSLPWKLVTCLDRTQVLFLITNSGSLFSMNILPFSIILCVQIWREQLKTWLGKWTVFLACFMTVDILKTNDYFISQPGTFSFKSGSISVKCLHNYPHPLCVSISSS